MKKLLIIITFILSSCAIDTGPGPRLISEDSIALFKSDWKPSIREAKRALIAVERYLEIPDLKDSLYTNNMRIKKMFCEIVKNIYLYKVQIGGIKKDGKKIIYCSFLNIDLPEKYWKWRKRRILMRDAGIKLWQILYDTETDKCFNLYISGEKRTIIY